MVVKSFKNVIIKFVLFDLPFRLTIVTAAATKLRERGSHNLNVAIIVIIVLDFVFKNS